MAFFVIVLVACSSAAYGIPAVLYDNGPFNGTIDAWTINSGFQVADSFPLSGSSTLTGVNFTAWLFSGDTANTVDWAIVGDPTNQAGTTFFSGTGAVLTPTFLTNNGFGYGVYNENFSLGSLSLGAGTYWLVLQNAVSSQNQPVYWDENDGASQAWQSSTGFLTVANGNCGTPAAPTTSAFPPSGNCSETFQILGTNTAVPEPGTLALGVCGLFVVALTRRRRA